MTVDILITPGTDIVVADTTDYAGDLGSRTDQIDLTSLAAAAARQSDVLDFGATRADLWAVFAAIEPAVDPTSLDVVEFYMAWSLAAAGTAKPGGCSGSDGAYTGSAGDSLADSLPQLDHIGPMVLTSDDDPVVQFALVSTIFVPMRYGCLVVVNNSAQAFHSDAVEMGVLFRPLKTQSQ